MKKAPPTKKTSADPSANAGAELAHALFCSTGNQLVHSAAAAGPGQQGVGDFTDIKTRAGFLYFAVVLDLLNRKIVGWSLSRTRNARLPASALRMALPRERTVEGCLFRSDQGVESVVHQHDVANDIEAVARNVECIEYYIRDRLHSRQGYQTPAWHERLCA